MAGGGPAIMSQKAEIGVESGTAASAKNAQINTPSVDKYQVAQFQYSRTGRIRTEAPLS